jgi:putative transposase
MTRPLRIEFPGAVYHVTSRGDRREAIYADDGDRAAFLTVLTTALQRCQATALAYCLMTNHYHLVLQTQEANLSLLMRHLNGVYTQTFNRRHGLTGHLFQGRFKAILVDSDAYLMTLCQYMELNPVRARMVESAEQWSWSSYLAHTGRAPTPDWLDGSTLASFVLQREAQTVADFAESARLYERAVHLDPPQTIWSDGLRQQIYLGDEDFVHRMQARVDAKHQQDSDIPKAQRARLRTLAEWMEASPTREAALLAAHVESGISMTDLAQQLGLSVARISQLIKRAEATRGWTT